MDSFSPDHDGVPYDEKTHESRRMIKRSRMKLAHKGFSTLKI